MLDEDIDQLNLRARYMHTLQPITRQWTPQSLPKRAPQAFFIIHSSLYSILRQLFFCQISTQSLQKSNSSFTEIKPYSICYFLRNSQTIFKSSLFSFHSHQQLWEFWFLHGLSGFDNKIMLISKLAGKCLPSLFTRMCEKG